MLLIDIKIILLIEYTMNNYTITVSVIAHIDHGKTTFCTNFVKLFSNIDCCLDLFDTLVIEKEKNITIKLKVIRISRKFDNCIININILDTPGHYDFMHEVESSILVCDLVLLLIDVTQGVQKQTIAYSNIARDLKKDVFLLVCKCDLLNKYNILEHNFGISVKYNNIYFISSHNQYGFSLLIDDLCKYVIEYNKKEKLQLYNNCLMLIDSYIEKKSNDIVDITVKLYGNIFKGQSIFIGRYNIYINDIYMRTPSGIVFIDTASCNDIVIIRTRIKKQIRRIVLIPGNLIKFCATTDIEKSNYINLQIRCWYILKIYIMNTVSLKYKNLLDILYEINIYDYGFRFEACKSDIMGDGFICFFTGDFHAKIFFIRLESYKIEIKDLYIVCPDHTVVDINNNIILPYNLSHKDCESIYLKYVKLHIYINDQYIYSVINFIKNKMDGVLIIDTIYIDSTYYKIIIGLSEKYLYLLYNYVRSIKDLDCYVVYENHFNDLLKCTKIEYSINNIVINTFSTVAIGNNDLKQCIDYTEIIAKSVERQQFHIVVHCIANGRKIRRVLIQQYRKDVTTKCKSDINRKMKLLKKQKIGKKIMANKFSISNININFSRLFNILNI